MELNKELLVKAKEAKTPEELLTLAKENGADLTEESARTYFDLLHPQTGELSDDELDNVSGGGCGPTYYEACMANGYCSDYICSRCGSRGIIVRNGELRCSGCLAYNPRCWNCMNSIGDKRSKILTCKIRLRRGAPE